MMRRIKVKEVLIPIGKNKNNKIQNLSLGLNTEKSISSHVILITGINGSGMSNLLDLVIKRTKEKYTKDNLDIGIINLKNGDEFKKYGKDKRIFRLSQNKTKNEQKKELFKYQEILEERLRNKDKNKEYKRLLLIVNNFTELFKSDNKELRNESIDILDRILRIGRSTGLSLILTTETFKNTDIPDYIFTNLPQRMTLKTDKADIEFIFQEDNTEALTIRDVGEAVYNSSFGSIGLNEKFKIDLV